MIVDTSALIAIVFGERGWESLRNALANGDWAVPAPALTEFRLATAAKGERVSMAAETLIARLIANQLEVVAFEKRHAELTKDARVAYGRGNGFGGKLNFGDLMVYAVAKDRSAPLLCTGRDFASTDLEIHPASRLDR